MVRKRLRLRLRLRMSIRERLQTELVEGRKAYPGFSLPYLSHL
jgi:hypothetical protein